MKKTFIFLVLIIFAGCKSGGSSSTVVDDSNQNTDVYDLQVQPITNGSWYKPTIDTTWQWQLQGDVNTSYNVDVYDIDLFDSSKELIKSIQDSGKKVICYFNGGAYEPYRSDSNLFPKEVLGNNMGGWEDERWLDISSYERFSEIIIGRLDLAVEKNCDGVEIDNIDAYQNNNGFDLTYEDQLKYNIWLSNEAHKRNLSIALKNDIEQINYLINYLIKF